MNRQTHKLLVVAIVLGAAGLSSIQAQARGGGGGHVSMGGGGHISGGGGISNAASVIHTSSSSTASHPEHFHYYRGRGWGRGWGGHGYYDDANPYAWGGNNPAGAGFANELDDYNRQREMQNSQLPRAAFIQEYSWPQSNPTVQPTTVSAYPAKNPTLLARSCQIK
jgi:hypothetical protein